MWLDFLPVIFIVGVGLAFLGVWWYSVAVIQPRTKKRHYDTFMTYVTSRGGKEIPLPKLGGLTIFDFGSKKFDDLNRQAEEAHPLLGTQQLYGDHQAEIQLAGRTVRVAFGSVGESEETTTKILFWRLKLHGTVDGWARLRPTKSRFKGASPEVDVESIEFNQEVQIHAHPKKLAFSLFAPNVLDWYLTTSHRPWTYVLGNDLFIVAEAAPQPGKFEEIERDIIYLVDAIERSGALERSKKIA